MRPLEKTYKKFLGFFADFLLNHTLTGQTFHFPTRALRDCLYHLLENDAQSGQALLENGSSLTPILKEAGIYETTKMLPSTENFDNLRNDLWRLVEDLKTNSQKISFFNSTQAAFDQSLGDKKSRGIKRKFITARYNDEFMWWQHFYKLYGYVTKHRAAPEATSIYKSLRFLSCARKNFKMGRCNPPFLQGYGFQRSVENNLEKILSERKFFERWDKFSAKNKQRLVDLALVQIACSKGRGYLSALGEENTLGFPPSEFIFLLLNFAYDRADEHPPTIKNFFEPSYTINVRHFRTDLADPLRTMKTQGFLGFEMTLGKRREPMAPHLAACLKILGEIHTEYPSIPEKAALQKTKAQGNER